MPLFKIRLEAENNRNLSPRVEYVKAKSLKFLRQALVSAINSPHSEYYGYRKLNIQLALGVPELCAININKNIWKGVK